MNPIELKKEMKAQRAELLEQLKDGSIDRPALTLALNDMVDNAVSKVADHFLGDYADKAALVFTGANGRQELSPFSDLDVFLVVDPSLFDGQTIPEDQADFRERFTKLNMAMMDGGFDLSSVAIRTPDHCVEDALGDQETWTQLIDRRHGWGSPALFAEMDKKLEAVSDRDRKAFVQSKFEEYDKRLAHFEDVEHSKAEGGKTAGGRYAVIEPDVKNGYGALRGYQTAQWVSKAHNGSGVSDVDTALLSKQDAETADQAYSFLFDIRAHLHEIAGKEDDTLYSNAQPEIAQRLGYDNVVDFMRDYFQATREISHYAKMVCSDVADQLDIKPPGTISDNVLDFDGPVDDPMQILEIYKQRVEKGESLSHNAVHSVRNNAALIDDAFVQNEDANRVMLGILSHDDAADTLIQMNKNDVLARMVPELAPIRDLIQFDPYHAYTVDQHTIVAIGNVSDIANQEHADLSPAASGIAENLTSDDRAVLAVALLLHDVYKAADTDDMKGFNKAVIETAGVRLGLEEENLERATWLAQNHLLLKHTSRYEDIDEPQAIERFAAQIPDLKHLELLRVLTLADTLALGPGRLSPHAAYRADTIYERARQNISGLNSTFNRKAQQLPDDYEAGEPYVRFAANAGAGADVLTVITPDKPYLLENITATLDRSSSRVLNARISTLSDGNGETMAVNRFVVQNSVGQMHTERQGETLVEALTKAIAAEERIKIAPVAAFNDPSKNPKNQVFDVDPQVEFSNALSETETSIKVTARARPHLLHALTSVISDMDLNLTHALITERGHQSVDVFKVQTRDGLQISRKIQDAVRGAMMAQIEEDDAPRPDA